MENPYGETRHKVIVLPEKKDWLYEERTISVDQDDYLNVCGFVLTSGCKCKDPGELVQISTSYPRLEKETRARVAGFAKDGTIVSVFVGRPGNLRQLNKLRALFLTVESDTILSSMKDVKNIQELSLTGPVTKMSDDLGDMDNLTGLYLQDTKLTSVPASIGRLKNLRNLRLESARDLSILPVEVGNLASLKELDLSNSKVITLPDSITRLKNLNVLRLANASALLKLPEGMEKFANLKVLDLQNATGITFLPDSTKTIKGLLCLHVWGTSMSELDEDDTSEFASKLIQSFPSLGYLDEELVRGREKLELALACNRFRFRTGLGTTPIDNNLSAMPKFWPHLIENPKQLFATYSSNEIGFGTWLRLLPKLLRYDHKKLFCPDVIYLILVDGMEEFIIMLLTRSNSDRQMID